MADDNMAEPVPSDVFTPRDYQVDLLEDAKQENIIVLLSTGSGKTFIAIMLIKEMSPAIRTPWSEGGKRTFFLVNTVPLVEQQAKAIKQHTDLRVGQFVGSSTLDAWNRHDWDVHLDNNQVLVMSAQIFCNMLEHGFVDVSRVNLLIMDECHHARKSSPMRQIMQLVHHTPAGQRPKKLGMSASIINQKISPAKLEKGIKDLEDIMGCSVRTSYAESVIKYSTRPQEAVLECADFSQRTALHRQLEAVAERCLHFLRTHRYSPQEIYGDEYDEFMRNVPNPVHEPKQIVSDFIYILNTLGPWCADRAAMYFMVEVEKMRRKTSYDRHFLLLGIVLTDLLRIRTLCKHIFEELDLREQIFQYSSPKVLRLIEILRDFEPPAGPNQLSVDDQKTAGLPETRANAPQQQATAGSGPEVPAGGNPGERQAAETEAPSQVRTLGASEEHTARASIPGQELAPAAAVDSTDELPPRVSCSPGDLGAICGLVFVKQRITAKVLCRLIKELRTNTPELSFLHPQCIVGGHKTYLAPAEVAQAEREKQAEVLRRFREYECNLLVSTSVLEEGMDVPRCNLVVRFDPPAEYRSYVQSKGRARAAAANYVLLATSGERDNLLRELANYQLIERLLTAHGREDSEEPSETEQLRALAERHIPPYRLTDEPTSPVVTRNSAIALINRYCQQLPGDMFTPLAPQWNIEVRSQDEEQLPPLRRCHLRLPINSPVRDEVQGDWFPSKRLARQSAAMKMCRVIREAGELDDHLLPIGSEALLEDDADEQRELVADGAPQPGTTKRRQYYKKQTAPPLSGPPPQPGQRCYLYQFDTRLACPIPDDQNPSGRRLFHPEHHPRRLGLLTGQPLPEVCAFPIFTRSGEVEVSVRLVTDQLKLMPQQLQLLATFHQFVFGAVLRLEKFPMRFQPDDSATSFLVVPINNDVVSTSLTVDWPFLERVTPRYGEQLESPSDQARRHFQFSSEAFHDAVIMPWYRDHDQPEFFCIAEVCEQLSPSSALPESDFGTFTEYYQSKYGIGIQNQTQPLLRVVHTPIRFNMLTSRFVNRKGVALQVARPKTKLAKRKQLLVPELCTVHPFPASLWQKLVTLPSVLYRLNGLMLADGLRRKVAIEVHLGTPDLAAGGRWPQLEFGWRLADVLQRRRKVSRGHDALAAGGDGAAGSPPAAPGENDRPAFEVKRPRRQQLDSADDLELAALEAAPGTLLDGPAGDAASGDAAVRCGSPSYLGGGGGGWGDAGADCGAEDASLDSGSDLGNTSDQEDEEEEGEASAATRTAAAPPAAAAPLPPAEEEEEEDVFDFEEGATTLEAVRERMERRRKQARRRAAMAEEMNSGDAVTMTAATAEEMDSGDAATMAAAMAEEIDSEDAATMAAAMAEEMDSGDSVTMTAAMAEEMASEDASTMAAATASAVPAEQRTTESESTWTTAAPVATARRAQPPPSGTTTRPEPETRSSDRAPEGAAGRVIVATPAAGGPTAFDLQPDLDPHPGPSPALLLQAITMSSANDGINLERLETVGDSFLKFAVTVHLYLTYPNIHEGRLTCLRSSQVSNLNLYRLGRAKSLGELMAAANFSPYDNWLPPGYTVPEGLEEAAVESGLTDGQLNLADMTNLAQMTDEAEVRRLVRDQCQRARQRAEDASVDAGVMPAFLPYNLRTHQKIPDKSVADCAESLIGAYLITCGPKGALVFMSWLGIKVLPRLDGVDEGAPRNRRLQQQRRRPDGPARPISSRIEYGDLPDPPSPLHCQLPDPLAVAAPLLSGLDHFEQLIQYEFRDKFYLLQAFTHASYHRNSLTDCYQRLEFLGDAVLDYLITRHLYEDRRNHSPGALTDLRSALVNNAIFATLAVRYNFHKYFLHYSPGLNQVITKFLSAYGDGDRIAEEYLYIQEDECEAAEDIEVPKALGDVFESVAGAIYLDSGMSLDTVWRVYFRMMQSEIETFSEHVPKSPIRELLELEPDTAKFKKPEREINGKVRVTVEVFGKGSYKGLGRNYRIAKCTAAKRALRALKRMKANRVTREQLFMYGANEPL